MKTLLIFLLAFAALILMSCEKTIVLDLEQTQPRLVVEAFLTFDSAGNTQEAYVRLSKSAWFYDKGKNSPVSGAKISVNDGERSYEFAESASEKGYYLPKEVIKGRFGKNYFLEIEAEGKKYNATDKLHYTESRISKLESKADEKLKKMLEKMSGLTDKEKSQFYRVFLFAQVVKTPGERTNFRFKFFQNGKNMNFDGQGVFVSDDEFISEKVDGVEFPTTYALNDTAKIEIYAISRDALTYYMDLTNVLNNDGGMWGPVPANARTNLSGGALGFFQVSAMISSEMIVK
jgi:hypothetical protein